MPLVTCLDCERPVSDQAASCPGCGRPMWTRPQTSLRSGRALLSGWLVLGVLVLLLWTVYGGVPLLFWPALALFVVLVIWSPIWLLRRVVASRQPA